MSFDNRGVVQPQVGFNLLARLTGQNGGYPSAGEISTIVWSATDLTSNTTVVSSTSLTPVSTYLYATPQLDSGWEADSKGYNFKVPIPGTALTSNEHLYHLDFVITPVVGVPVNYRWEIETSLSYNINPTESLVFSEVVTVQTPHFPVSKSDGITLTEAIIVSVTRTSSVSDGMTFSETVTLAPIGAAQFNGTNQWLQAPDGTSQRTVNAASTTITCWFKVLSYPNGAANAGIIAKDDDLSGPGSDYFFLVLTVSHNLLWQIQYLPVGGDNVAATVSWANSAGTIQQPALSTWYFAVLTYDATAPAKVRIRINATPYDTTADASARLPNQSTTPFTIGSDLPHSGIASFGNVIVGNVGFFNRLLTEDEIWQLWNPTPPTGNGTNPGTLQASAGYAADVPAGIAANVYSLSLNGTSQYVSFPQIVLNPDPVVVGNSFAIWFKANAVPSGVILGYSASFNTIVRLSSSTAIRIQSDGIGTLKDYTVPTMVAGTWYHMVVAITSAGSCRVYLDGTESSSGAQAFGTNAFTFDQIGKYADGSSGNWWSGYLSELQIYQRVLSATECAGLHAGTYTTRSQIIRYYKLNEGSGSTAKDSTPGAGRGCYYNQLPAALTAESTTTFPNWWDLNEPVGSTRRDSRAGGTNLSDHGTVPVASGIPGS